MTPYNVLATVDFSFLSGSNLRKRSETLPLHDNVMPAIEESAYRMRKAIWNLITLSRLRSAFVFTQESDGIEWTIFESERKPVSKLEARGMFALTIQELKDNHEVLKKISVPRSDCDTPHKPVIKFLHSLAVDQPFFVIFAFEHFLFATGTFYNESLMCEALINFRVSSPKQNKIIDKRYSDGLSYYLQKRKPSFSVEVPDLSLPYMY